LIETLNEVKNRLENVNLKEDSNRLNKKELVNRKSEYLTSQFVKDSMIDKNVEIKYKKLGAQIESLKRSINMFKSLAVFFGNLARQSLIVGTKNVFYDIFKNLYEKSYSDSADPTHELKIHFENLSLTSIKHLANLEKVYNNLKYSKDLNQFIKFYSDIQVKAEAMERKRNECLNNQVEIEELKHRLETMKKELSDKQEEQLVNHNKNITILEKSITDKINKHIDHVTFDYYQISVSSYINAKNLLTDDLYYNLENFFITIDKINVEILHRQINPFILKLNDYYTERALDFEKFRSKLKIERQNNINNNQDYLKEFFDSVPSEINPFEIPYLEYNICEMINCHVNDDIQDGELSLGQLNDYVIQKLHLTSSNSEFAKGHYKQSNVKLKYFKTC
jgi:hypothetical protein